jgi:hypothetical protein
MTNVLAVLSFRPARGCLDRRTRRLQELLAELVQTNKGIIIALRSLVNWSSPKKVDMDRTDRSVSLGVFSAFGSVD